MSYVAMEAFPYFFGNGDSEYSENWLHEYYLTALDAGLCTGGIDSGSRRCLCR